MGDNSEILFQMYLEESFPGDGKRMRSDVTRKSIAWKIVNYLKG